MSKLSRRSFIGKGVLATGVGALLPLGLKSCSSRSEKLNLLKSAPDGRVLKAGLIGCGSRGTGAVFNYLDAGDDLEIIALGDVYSDKLEKCRTQLLKQRGVEVDSEKCFVGFDAYEKVIDAGVDIVLMATPPYFRPQHFEAAIKAGKHVFMEKPVAVDPPGVRKILINSLRAQESGLSVVTGTIRRHQEDYLATYKQVQSGAIGKIVSGNCYYNQGKLWQVNPRSEWSELESMIRNWVNWTWLSGDHIVEQHIHNLDLMNWYIGSHPLEANGFGSRQRRNTGDQFDNFSVDYIYPGDVHVHSMCRQISGCSNKVGDYIRGTYGYTNCANTIFHEHGGVQWQYPEADKTDGKRSYFAQAFVQELIDLIAAIRTDKPLNEGVQVAESTLTAIMGRISAYTGKVVTWDEMLNSELHLGPKNYIMGDYKMDHSIPVPGQ